MFTYDFTIDELQARPLTTSIAGISQLYGAKYMNFVRVIVAGSYDSFIKADASSFTFSKKLGVIYDVSYSTSSNTCEGLT